MGVLVRDERWFGIARMVWPAGHAWVPSVGSKPLVFSTARVGPSIGSQAEGKESRAAALSTLQGHVPIPEPLWTLGRSRWSLW